MSSRLLAVIVIAALLVGIGSVIWFNLADAHPAAVRNKYLRGEITLEEAREEVGDQADDWIKYKRLLDEKERTAD
jgi:hypothetical protein